jgi:hypothetical protein
LVQTTAHADTTFTITNNGATSWNVAGVAGTSPTLTLVQGQTYNFAVGVNGHPLFISTTANSPSGPHFTTGVTGENAQMSTLVFVVPTGTGVPSTLFYQCGVHSAMSGQLNIVAPAPVPATGTIALVGLAALVLVAGFFAMRRKTRAS